MLKKRDVLSDAEADHLLIPHEVIRDPVQYDIAITALERRIIDTEAFQRLRAIKQLGPTHLVYPGAEHSRFQHSLGALQAVENLILIANRNHGVYGQVELLRVPTIEIRPYPHLLTRLCTLVHDLAHIPFGHTLEDEGHLFPDEWNDRFRLIKWLGLEPNEDFAQILKDNGKDQEFEKQLGIVGEVPEVIRQFLKASGLPPGKIDSLLNDLRTYTRAKDPMGLEFPFISDLISNTLCADLLDYIERDMYFCGLRERCGDRVTKYLAVLRVDEGSRVRNEETQEEYCSYKPIVTEGEQEKGKGRLVLLTYRLEQEHPAQSAFKVVKKEEILSEAIDLLRRRYALAEKVYFHRTKTAASAMLISAVASSSITLPKLYEYGDAALLEELSRDPNERTKKLMNAYRCRRLYKPIYKVTYKKPSENDQQSKKLWEICYPKCRQEKWRLQKETALESYIKAPVGSIVIYCPDRKMNMKAFDMLIQTKPEKDIFPLRHIQDNNRSKEMTALNERYNLLWNLQIFVDPMVLDVTRINEDTVRSLSLYCEMEFDLPNDIEELRSLKDTGYSLLVDHVIADWEKEHKETVPATIRKQLLASVNRNLCGTDQLMRLLKNDLEVLMNQYKTQKSK